LYVGLSRARDQLVVCGDPAQVAEVGGTAVLRHLLSGTTRMSAPTRRVVHAGVESAGDA